MSEQEEIMKKLDTCFASIKLHYQDLQSLTQSIEDRTLTKQSIANLYDQVKELGTKLEALSEPSKTRQ